MMPAHDDIPGVLWNMSVAPSRWPLYFTTAMMLDLNSVVAGAATALAVAALSAASLGVAVAAGGVLAILSIALHARHRRNWQLAGAAQGELLSPSPTRDVGNAPSDADG
jgi:hypothetical protein